jgi:hypothetical protein
MSVLDVTKPVLHGTEHDPAGNDPFTWDNVWPIGSVFLSVVDTDPSTLLGFGTWAAIAAGKVLIGLDSGDADFDTVMETGGVKTSTPDAHTGGAVDAHAAHTHTITHTHNIAHTHGTNHKVGTQTGLVNDAALGVTASGASSAAGTGNPSASLTHAVTNPAAHAAMSIVQPYYVVYMWKRTA